MFHRWLSASPRFSAPASGVERVTRGRSVGRYARFRVGLCTGWRSVTWETLRSGRACCYAWTGGDANCSAHGSARGLATRYERADRFPCSFQGGEVAMGR